MRWSPSFVALLALSINVAHSGPNSNGAIIVHASDSYVFSVGDICTTTLGQPASCDAAVTTSPQCGDGGGLPSNVTTIWFLAAFLPTAAPAVASVYFGTDVDEVNVDAGTRYGFCGNLNTVEDVSETWPYDGGATVGFGTPIIGNWLFRFYYFGVESVDCDPAPPNPWWCSAANPVGGYAAFYDPSFPPVQDPITQFGCMKWYEDGFNECPEAPQGGICCAPDGACTMAAELDCPSPSVWHLEWTSCMPNPCPAPPVEGVCCWPNGTCAISSEAGCVPPGVLHPDWYVCAPNPCPWVPPGPNTNGAIIVHTNDAYGYSASTVCATPLGTLASCEESITRSDKATGAVVWFLAAFLPTSTPSVAGIYFGNSHDEAALNVTGSYGFCGPEGSVEAPDNGWPSNDAGNSLAFGSPITCQNLFRFYYFVVDESSGGPGPYFCSAVNPTGGYAAFYDPSFPPAQDYIAQFGCVKWYADGYNQCPQVLPTGACCALDGACTVTTEFSCLVPSVWHDEWTSCMPNTCPIAPRAACCAETGSCTITFEIDCVAPSDWHPEWTSCEPNNCPQPTRVCCAADGGCTLTTPAGCAAPSVWHIEWASCEPNNCPKPTAACCAPNGDCTVRTQAACLAPSVWHPEWTTCHPNNCPMPVPVLQSPADGATCVASPVTFRWSDIPGEDDCYKIQIGAACGTGTMYLVCSPPYRRVLNPGTTYFWRVAAVNDDGVIGTFSSCYSFTTAPSLLAAPTLLTPSHAATDQPLSGTLTWASVTGAAGYRLWIGASLTVGEEHDVTAPQYSYSGLQGGTTYYWRVMTKNNCNSYGHYSGIFEFTTLTPTAACCAPSGICAVTTQAACAAPSVWHSEWTVCAPNNCPPPPAAAACCDPAGVCTLTSQAGCLAPSIWHPEWTACPPGNCPPPPPGGACCDTATGSCTISTEAACSFNWLGADIPCNATSCETPPSDCALAMGFPNGGQVLKAGKTYTITWTATSCGPTVRIELLLNGIVRQRIASTAENDGSFPWIAAQFGEMSNGYKIRVTDLASSTVAQSVSPFSIAPSPTATPVVSPGGDVDWFAGQKVRITWLAAGGGSTVKIELIRDGVPCLAIAAAAPNTGSFDWSTEPCRGSGGNVYRVRVTDLQTGAQGVSDGSVRILRADDRTASKTSIIVPNPFRPNALVVVELAGDAEVHAGIYGVTGQMVRNLLDRRLRSGRHEITWDGRDYTGMAAPSGIYYLRAVIESESITKKILLIH